MPDNLPLSRFTVLDLARVRSGPTAVRQLADWGANCIKIEAPEAIETTGDMGGPRHGPDFQNLHRNKRSMTLNLKDAVGHAAFMRMVEQADVVVENFRPDVKTRLKVDYKSCRSVNPRIVYGSVSGFGQDGPYSGRPGFDQIAQGMGGLMWITGIPGQGPVRVGIPVADLTAGMYTAMGILIALLQREETGVGQHVHTSLLEAQISMLDFQATRWITGNKVPGQAGNNHPTSIPTGVFQTSDGFINIATTGEKIWQRLCRAIGADDLIEDTRYSDGPSRLENRDACNADLQKHLLDKTSAEWVEILNEAGVACGPIYKMDEMWADEQVSHLDMSRAVTNSEVGELNVVRNAVNLSEATDVPYTGSPERGEHTETILSEFGFSSEEIETMKGNGIV
ncbi:TPA: formyl-CoA transferase [Candidatus Latescibacteria bacterium]|nr:formyl-CoA transferase [Candidatus Latescibacterota bacterium]